MSCNAMFTFHIYLHNECVSNHCKLKFRVKLSQVVGFAARQLLILLFFFFIILLFLFKE